MEPRVEPRGAQPAEEGGPQKEWKPGQDQRVVPERGLMEGGRRAGRESLGCGPGVAPTSSIRQVSPELGPPWRECWLDLQRLETLNGLSNGPHHAPIV